MKEIIVNADGGSRGNPGPAAVGVVVRDNERVIEEYKEVIGEATNNVAEYRALIRALDLALKNDAWKVKVIMDSELVVKQMKGEYKVRKKHLIPLYVEAKELEKNFKKVSYLNVRREDKFQKEADRLVNEALNESS